MSSLVFLVSGGLMVGVMMGGVLLLSKGTQESALSFSPLESGLATVGKTYCVLSVQMLMILILFLVLDLEVIFIVSLVFSGGLGILSSSVFMGFIMLTLWAEWEWGKLYWAI